MIADRPPMRFPAEAPVVRSFPPETLASTPVKGPTMPESIAKSDETLVEQELRIWLRVNRYVLSKNRLGRDATDEFLTWRQSNHL